MFNLFGWDMFRNSARKCHYSPWHGRWYQDLHESHSNALAFQVTPLQHDPHGNLGTLGPGFSSTRLPSNCLMNRW